MGDAGRMIRTEKYKYCIYDKGEHREQLFHMEEDPGEMINLVYDKKYQKELQSSTGPMHVMVLFLVWIPR